MREVPPAPRPVGFSEATVLLQHVAATAGEGFTLRGLRNTDRITLARVLRDRLNAGDPTLLAELGRVLGDSEALCGLFPRWEAVHTAGCLTSGQLLGKRDAEGEPEADALAQLVAFARDRLRGGATSGDRGEWQGPNLTRERLARERAAREASHG